MRFLLIDDQVVNARMIRGIQTRPAKKAGDIPTVEFLLTADGEIASFIQQAGKGEKKFMLKVALSHASAVDLSKQDARTALSLMGDNPKTWNQGFKLTDIETVERSGESDSFDIRIKGRLV
jgi:hypothetical protein